jgi:hypothetical protein
MCKSIFNILFHHLRADNSGEVTVRRRFIPAEEKLMVTLITAILLAKMALYMSSKKSYSKLNINIKYKQIQILFLTS